ncbi:MAG: ATP-binding protein [candidate division Zixibacteria bacterium]|nr:ATP-binding protein [candidate division Zixibacteria bacterium]MDD5425769.1 ATP-binding protein [candidate division Zixibacteria bacterium]
MSLFGKIFRANLRLKIIIPTSVMLVLSLLVISGYLIQRQSESILRELEISGETILKMLAVNAESGVLFESRYELDELLNILSNFESVEYAIITNKEGVILSQTGRRVFDSTWKSREFKGIHNKDETLKYSIFKSEETGQEVLNLTTPIITKKEILNRENLGITSGISNSMAKDYISEEIGRIELGMSLEKVNRSIMVARTAALLLAVIILIFTILMLTFIISAIIKPVTELVQVTDQISKGDFSRMVEIDQKDEIGQLAETFNKMIHSLKQSRDEIEQYNRTLEEKIFERTQQLEEAQAQLIQSEKMGALGQLAAGVAHELNNPLGGILGYAQFTLEKLKKNIPEKTTLKEIESYIRYVTDIECQSRRCKTIVQNLLRFSRASKNIEFEDVNINRTIEETITFVEHQLHLNQIELEVSLAGDLPVIQGNVGQLQQVFTNLIINAMHASKPGSKILITSRYSPALGEFGGAVELQFIDHGSGINEENLKRIFEPFFTTKEVGKGTGLGLSVSYGIIKAHEGEILVSSTPGKGTTFTIILPVQKPARNSDNVKEQTINEQ